MSKRNKKVREKHRAAMFDVYRKIKRCRKWHLKSLEIGRCEELQTLPEEIRQLKWLKKLSVTNTGINILPEWIGELINLTVLNLADNKIALLPESFGNLKSLSTLSIQRDMRIDLYFPPSMKNLRSLREVSVNVFHRLPDFIGELKDLTSLMDYKSQKP